VGARKRASEDAPEDELWEGNVLFSFLFLFLFNLLFYIIFISIFCFCQFKFEFVLKLNHKLIAKNKEPQHDAKQNFILIILFIYFGLMC
jgi:hypothetical protein